MSKNSSKHNDKRLARLAAIQGLYQIALTGRSPDSIIKDFHEHPTHLLGEAVEGDAVVKVDHDLFGNVVSGVTKNADMLDEMLAGAFDEKVTANRIEILLRAILRAGAYELHHHAAISSGVIINDYVDVTHAFFGAKEPGLVNAVLDRLGKSLRG